MLELLTIASLCSIIFLLARRLVRKHRGKKVAAPKARAGLEAWIAGEVAGIVAKKLALAKDDVSRAMGGDPDADLVTAIERVVSRVDLTYERLIAGQIELRADVRFEDGTSDRATRMLGWSEVPDVVRGELSRTGASQVHRAWALPWGD
jgi:hypothetical protein